MVEDAEHVDLTQLINAEAVQMALGFALAAGHPDWDERFREMVVHPTLTQAIADGIVKIVVMGGPEQVRLVHDLISIDTGGRKPS